MRQPKIRSKTAVIVLLLITVTFVLCKGAYGARLRGIHVTVLDAQTAAPIPNALIYYEVTTARWNHRFGVPIIDPTVYEDVIREEYRTDEKGSLSIPARSLRVGLYETLYADVLCVNLGLEAKSERSETNAVEFFRYFNIHDWKNVERFENPLPTYRGTVLYSSREEDLDPVQMGGTVRKKFDVQWISRGLAKKREDLTIRLKQVKGTKP